jgi:hypothetical protein
MEGPLAGAGEKDFVEQLVVEEVRAKVAGG